MSWECSRCRTVHSDLIPSCHCPPPTGTATNTASPEAMQVTVEAVQVTGMNSLCLDPLLSVQEVKLMQYLNALESFHNSFKEFEDFFRDHYSSMEEARRLLGEATSWFDLLSHGFMDLSLIEEIERRRGKGKVASKICPRCQRWIQWDPDTWQNVGGKGVIYVCPQCVQARKGSGV